MKTLGAIIKVMTALATVAGAIYIIATYGDKIVAWAKEMMAKCPCTVSVSCEKEEAAEEEAVPTAEEIPAEEEPVAEAPVEESAPVADEADFEG